MKMTLDSILQWNLQSYRTKLCELKLLIKDISPACICLQETRIQSANIYPPSGYDILHRPCDPDNGHDRGVAVLVSKEVSHQPLNLRTDLQAIAVKLRLQKNYSVCSLYLPHSPLNKQQLSNLIDQLEPPFLLLGDMNAHSPMWGSAHENERGKIITELLQEKNIGILNDNSPTHYHIQNGTLSTIDLTIVSSDILTDFQFSVLPELHDSDHYPIKLTLSTPSFSYERPIRFKVGKANWNLFRELTRMENSELLISEDPDTSLTTIQDSMFGAALSSIPRTTGGRPKPSVPWWNSECQEAVRERKQAERALRRDHSLHNLTAYKRKKAKCRYVMNKSRKDCWRQYVSTITTRTSLKEVWKKVNKINQKYVINPPITLKYNNVTTSDPLTVANLLNQSFAKASSDENYSQDFIRYKRNNEREINFNSNNRNTMYNRSFSRKEFFHCLSIAKESSPHSEKFRKDSKKWSVQ